MCCEMNFSGFFDDDPEGDGYDDWDDYYDDDWDD